MKLNIFFRLEKAWVGTRQKLVSSYNIWFCFWLSGFSQHMWCSFICFCFCLFVHLLLKTLSLWDSISMLFDFLFLFSSTFHGLFRCIGLSVFIVHIQIRTSVSCPCLMLIISSGPTSFFYCFTGFLGIFICNLIFNYQA